MKTQSCLSPPRPALGRDTNISLIMVPAVTASVEGWSEKSFHFGPNTIKERRFNMGDSPPFFTLNQKS
jgi:hypothetical protein